MLYIKAIHIIFVVTWFAGLFYIVRLFIYNTEANEKPNPEKKILQNQFNIMIRRLWFGITWPSAIITLIFGPLTWFMLGGQSLQGMLNYLVSQEWFMWKQAFIFGLFAYHFSLQLIYKQQAKGIFKYTSGQLRVWNEVATVFLFAIVILVVVKQGVSLLWGMLGLAGLILLLMSGIKIYKSFRKGK